MAQCLAELPVGMCGNPHQPDAACGHRYTRWDGTPWQCELHTNHVGDHYEDRGHDGFTWWGTNTQRRDAYSWPSA